MVELNLRPLSMQGQEFWVKYLSYRPISIGTHYIDEDERKNPLKNIDNLIRAFQSRPGSSLSNIGLENIFLCPPDGFSRKDCANLGADAFYSEDENETRLRPDLPLASLGSIGSEYATPLIIKVVSGKLLYPFSGQSKNQYITIFDLHRRFGIGTCLCF